jgi:predicted RNA-binding Zn-ribbon protein involved in translation (DUF1610 family)
MMAVTTVCEDCGTELLFDEKARVHFCPTCEPERAAKIEFQKDEEMAYSTPP